MIRNALKRVALEHLSAKSTEFKGNPYGQYVRHEGVEAIRMSLNSKFSSFGIKGSVGQGAWADIPWIAIFYPVITTNATNGFYVVYLCRPDNGDVYLSLNQGTTEVHAEFGTGRKALDVLKNRAAFMRSRLGSIAEQFPTFEVELGSPQALPKGYEAGHVVGFKYNANALPSEATLVENLNTLLEAYVVLANRGGREVVDTSESESDIPNTSPLYESRVYRQHRRIERNKKAANQAKNGKPAVCEVCDFDFSAVYGALGAGYIEAHHLRPLHTLDEGETVEIDPKTDFVLLCANCHRMAHRLDNPGDIDYLVKLINS
jgi:5-methylcytosine-specific restriction enzyme A